MISKPLSHQYGRRSHPSSLTDGSWTTFAAKRGARNAGQPGSTGSINKTDPRILQASSRGRVQHTLDNPQLRSGRNLSDRIKSCQTSTPDV
jgi:hypothetical protein